MKTVTTSPFPPSFSKLREAISYGRFSSAQQGRTEDKGEGDSFNRQQEAYEAVCERYKDKVYPSTRFQFGEFFGRGESGFHGKHLAKGGSLRKFLDLLKDGTINPKTTCLVVERWSRFFRLPVDLAWGIISEVVRSGCVIALRSPEMWIDESNIHKPEVSIIVSVLVALAHAEALEKSDFTKSNRERIRESGVTKKGRKLKACPTWLDIAADGKGEKNANEDFTGYVFNDKADTLREAIRLYINGMGNKEIMDKLGLGMEVTPKGTKRKQQRGKINQLTRYFHNPALIGTLQHFKRVDGKKVKDVAKEGFYPALISEDTYRQLQDRVKRETNHRGMRTVQVNSLFPVGMIENEVGETLNVWQSSRKEFRLKKYKAGKWVNDGSKTTDYQMVEEALLDLFLNLTESDLYPKNTNDAQKDKLNLEAKIERLTGKIEVANKEAMEDEGSPELFKWIKAAEKQRAELAKQLDEVKNKLSVAKIEDFGTMKTLITELVEGKEGAERLELRSRLKEVIARKVKKITVQIHGSSSAGVVVEFLNGVEKTIGQVDKANGLQVAMMAG